MRIPPVCTTFVIAAIAGVGSAAEFRVGASSSVVTPPNSDYLAGYEHNRKSTGVHDDLFAKAVVFDDGHMPLAIVIVDSIGLPYPIVNAIRTRAFGLIQGLSLPSERIIVASTHCHCSPDVIGVYGPDEQHTGCDSAYNSFLVDTAAQTVVKAVKNLAPAKLVSAATVCDGWAVNDSEPGLVDHSVTILQCQRPDGTNIATLTNFACHPTVLDGDTTVCSSDWPGVFYKAMSESMPGEHVFIQGSIGGWVQPVTPERTFALAEKYGRDLAEKTLTALKNTTPLPETTIRFARRIFDVPCANDGFRALAAANVIQREIGETIETEVAWFAIGPAQFATHPGETSPAHGLATKEMMNTGPKFIVGLGLDELGYILKKDYFEKGKYPHADYLTSVSPGPAAEDAMLEALRQIVSK
jgi:hypothetical protein